MSKEEQTYLNTDKELYREPSKHKSMSYYQPSLHVTKEGKIGINVGGTVYVKSLKDWHELAGGAINLTTQRRDAQIEQEARIDELKAILKFEDENYPDGRGLYGRVKDRVSELEKE